MTTLPALLVADSLLELPTPATEPAQALAHKRRALVRAWERKYERAKAPATVKAVRSDWQTFFGWCQRAAACPIPAATKDLLRFLQDMVVRGRRRATLERYVYTIRLIHEKAGENDPTWHPDWKLEWEAIVRDLGRSDRSAPRQAEPLQTPQMAQIFALLDDEPDSPHAVRDIALLSLATDTLCREAELATVRLQDLKPAADGAWTLYLGRHKSDQHGIGAYRYVSAETKARIDRWCTLAQITSDYLFLPIGGRPKQAPAKPEDPPPPPHLRPQEIAKIFRRRARQAGLSTAMRISGHSSRVGSAVDLAESGASESEIMFAGGWQSERMVRRYTKRAKAGSNAMAKLRAKQREQG